MTRSTTIARLWAFAAALTITAVAVLASACGGGGGGATTPAAPEGTPTLSAPSPAVLWDASTIAAHIGLETAQHDVLTLPDGVRCGIPVILTSAVMVMLYGVDVIATNPDRTAGVKIVAAEAATCLAAITELLTTLDAS